MDDRTFQVVLALATAGIGYLLYQKFTKSTAGSTGGVAGFLKDVAIGADAPDTESSVYQAPTPGNQVPNPSTYTGAAVLGFFAEPKQGGVVRRQDFHGKYPVTIECKNMTPNVVRSPLVFEVDEGSETVVTITEPKSIDPGARKQFTVMLNTNTILSAASATCRVRFGSQYLTFTTYLIA